MLQYHHRCMSNVHKLNYHIEVVDSSFSSKSIKMLNLRSQLFRLENKYHPETVLTLFGPAYWKPKYAHHIVGFALPWMVYLDSPIYDYLSVFDRLTKYLFNFVRKLFLRYESDRLVVETNSVKTRISKVLNVSEDNIYVVPNTISSHFFTFRNDNKPNLSWLSSIKKTKVLMLSAYYKHKNFEIIRSAAADKRFSDFVFLVTLPNDQFKTLFGGIENIYNLGVQSAENCPYVYSYADIVLQPSLLECFSANYVEALFMEKPLVLTDFEFSRSVVREYGYYFRYDSLSSLYNALDAAKVNGSKINRSEFLELFPDAKTRALNYLNIIAG